MAIYSLAISNYVNICTNMIVICLSLSMIRTDKWLTEAMLMKQQLNEDEWSKMKRDDVCWWSDLFGGVIEQQSLKRLIRVFHQDQFFHFIVIGEMRGSLRRGSRSGNKKTAVCGQPMLLFSWPNGEVRYFFYMVEVRGIEPLSRNSPPYRRLQLISCLDNSAVCAWADSCWMCFWIFVQGSETNSLPWVPLNSAHRNSAEHSVDGRLRTYRRLLSSESNGTVSTEHVSKFSFCV